MVRSRRWSNKRGGGPAPEPPAAPPIIILSENSCAGRSQPQEQDPLGVPHQPTSLARSRSHTQNSLVQSNLDPTFSNLKPKPAPEPHPAPPVIILSHSEHLPSPSASGSRIPTSSLSRIHNGPVTRSRLHSSPRKPYTHHKMGSKPSKLAPEGGKLQSSQEKKDKEEMKEPTNYYTHRSKSMRRKAGKDASTDGAGGVSMGSGGAGGAI